MIISRVDDSSGTSANWRRSIRVCFTFPVLKARQFLRGETIENYQQSLYIHNENCLLIRETAIKRSSPYEVREATGSINLSLLYHFCRRHLSSLDKIQLFNLFLSFFAYFNLKRTLVSITIILWQNEILVPIRARVRRTIILLCASKAIPNCRINTTKAYDLSEMSQFVPTASPFPWSNAEPEMEQIIKSALDN